MIVRLALGKKTSPFDRDGSKRKRGYAERERENLCSSSSFIRGPSQNGAPEQAQEKKRQGPVKRPRKVGKEKAT